MLVGIANALDLTERFLPSLCLFLYQAGRFDRRLCSCGAHGKAHGKHVLYELKTVLPWLGGSSHCGSLAAEGANSLRAVAVSARQGARRRRPNA